MAMNPEVKNPEVPLDALRPDQRFGVSCFEAKYGMTFDRAPFLEELIASLEYIRDEYDAIGVVSNIETVFPSDNDRETSFIVTVRSKDLQGRDPKPDTFKNR